MASGIYVSNSVKVILGGEWGHFSLESVKIVHFHHLKVRKKKTLFLTCILVHCTIVVSDGIGGKQIDYPSLLKADFRLNFLEGMLIK